MANFNSPRSSMMDVDVYRSRAATREGVTRLVMALIGLLAAIIIAAIIYAAVLLIGQGLDFVGGQMEAYRDSQNGTPGG